MYLYTLFTPFSIPYVSIASASLLYSEVLSPSFYLTQLTKWPCFSHIIILSIKAGNFYLSQLPLSASLFNLSPVWLSLLKGQSMRCCACVQSLQESERRSVWCAIPGCPPTSVSHMEETVTGNSLLHQLQEEIIKE